MSTGLPSERAGPWYLNSEQIENSPSRQYYVRKYGTVERARTREQEARQTTCAFLQESGQKLRLCALSPCSHTRGLRETLRLFMAMGSQSAPSPRSLFSGRS